MKTLDLDLKKLATLLLPTFLRMPLFLALTGAATRALQHAHIDFGKYRMDADYRRHHTGQVCYLQAALNDTLDAELRRIRIHDTLRVTPVMFYPDADLKPVVFVDAGQSDFEPVVFGREALFGAEKQDFEVFVPQDIFAVASDINARTPREITARSIINRYKLASKRYLIKN